MRWQVFGSRLIFALAVAHGVACAQDEKAGAELRVRVVSSLPGHHRAVPAVIWLTSMPGTPEPSFDPHGHYVLMQKNRTFIPHLQVIPVGSVVDFPNADPFFHNVFSLYEGKRFDLGLYEAGASKKVTFPHEGVSYIFCNIHPEMSAVIVALSTPLYAIADENDSFSLSQVPPGDYKLHLWIEGVPQSVLDGLNRSVHLTSHDLDLGTISAPLAKPGNMTHTNKFGNPYDTHSESSY